MGTSLVGQSTRSRYCRVMSDKTQPDWRDFEIAVANFARAFSPEASVRDNVRMPDRHTKSKRQRDVWVEFPFGGVASIAMSRRIFQMY